jgi:hypothetical protein
MSSLQAVRDRLHLVSEEVAVPVERHCCGRVPEHRLDGLDRGPEAMAS